MGQTGCATSDVPLSRAASSAEILGDLVTEGGFDQNDAARIVYAAANTMCPDVFPRLQNESNAASRPKLKSVM
jgi:hypothetical protein